ncbi:MAG: hypothetical protein JXR71_12380 [Bacteroidales bacterium]|nr:hypothetical protein [Bacteroidales bacterium]
MKKFLITAIFAFLGLTVFAQTRLYVNPKFGEIAKTQKIIAVLPFKVSITLRPNQMKKITPEQLKDMQLNEGSGIQTAMVSWFMKRSEKGKLLVQVQQPVVTNAILKKAGVDNTNIDSYTPAQLAKILKVDAVIMGTFQTTKPMSEGLSAAMGVLFGVWGATNRATMNLFIYNAGDNQVLLNYNKGLVGSLGSSTQDLVNILMRKASRRIAYVSTK